MTNKRVELTVQFLGLLFNLILHGTCSLYVIYSKDRNEATQDGQSSWKVVYLEGETKQLGNERLDQVRIGDHQRGVEQEADDVTCGAHYAAENAKGNESDEGDLWVEEAKAARVHVEGKNLNVRVRKFCQARVYEEQVEILEEDQANYWHAIDVLSVQQKIKCSKEGTHQIYDIRNQWRALKFLFPESLWV